MILHYLIVIFVQTYPLIYFIAVLRIGISFFSEHDHSPLQRGYRPVSYISVYLLFNFNLCFTSLTSESLHLP